MAEGLIAAQAESELTALAAAFPWIKRHIGAPGAAATANPSAGTTRKQITWGSAATAAGNATISNSAVIEWTNEANAEDHSHYSLWSASSAGTPGQTGTITANAIQVGDTFRIPIGGLVLTKPVAT
jgi:hypothetical protein